MRLNKGRYGSFELLDEPPSERSIPRTNSLKNNMNKTLATLSTWIWWKKRLPSKKKVFITSLLKEE